MYELSTLYPDISGILPAYGWDAAVRAHDRRPAVHRPASQLSRIISSRSATASHSVTGAYLASRMLLRHYLGELDPADAPFAFTRYDR